MKIAVIDDYQDAFRKLKCHARLEGHEIIVYHDTEKDPGRLAARLAEADVGRGTVGDPDVDATQPAGTGSGRSNSARLAWAGSGLWPGATS